MNKIKHLNGERIIITFYEQELLLSKLKMSYYLERDSHVGEITRTIKLC